MSTTTGIQWPHHAFNPWWGCWEVHSGCANCYAKAWDRRYGGEHWGESSRRMILGEWSKPAQWNAAAKAAGEVRRVFVASMCDIFEEFDGPVVNQQGDRLYIQADRGGRVTHVPTAEPVTIAWLRARTLRLFEPLTNLRVLLLTKRPENITKMVPPEWLKNWPEHFWTGTSPCNQKTADESIPRLVRVPGRHFLSCEPLLGAITDGRFKKNRTWLWSSVDWVISGGESGPGARPNDLAWHRSLRDQCKAAGVPFFFKQAGSNAHDQIDHPDNEGYGVRLRFADKKGGDMAEWPKDLRVREVPE